jgi:hypothetical protein
MKIKIIIILIILIALPQIINAEVFLGAPVIPDGKTINKTNNRLEISTGLSHDEAVSFYRNQLEGEKDIKYREWKEATYIEDDGRRDWHSITISKGTPGAETTIIIAKDNWTWIIGTLILRYIGVFVVLLILFLGMKVSGNIISGMINRMDAKKTG